MHKELTASRCALLSRMYVAAGHERLPAFREKLRTNPREPLTCLSPSKPFEFLHPCRVIQLRETACNRHVHSANRVWRRTATTKKHLRCPLRSQSLPLHEHVHANPRATCQPHLLRQDQHFVGAAQAQHPSALRCPTKDRHALHRGHGSRVVRPSASIDEADSIHGMCRKVGWCCCRGHRNVNHRRCVVHLETRMVGSLEQAWVPSVRVPRRDHQAHRTLSQPPLSEHIPQRRQQWVGAVLASHQPAHTASHSIHPPPRSRRSGLAKDLRAVLSIELDDLATRQPKPYAERDDAARGRSHHQIEVVDDALLRRFLDLGEKRRGHHPLQAASIDGEYPARHRYSRRSMLDSFSECRHRPTAPLQATLRSTPATQWSKE